MKIKYFKKLLDTEKIFFLANFDKNDKIRKKAQSLDKKS